MVKVHATETHYVFTILGWHRIWSFESQIKVEKQNIISAAQSQDEFTWWIGWKIPGTQLPGIITAGTYIKKGERNFWDVSNKKNAIVVTVQNSSYHKLIIEVENPTETIKLLNNSSC